MAPRARRCIFAGTVIGIFALIGCKISISPPGDGGVSTGTITIANRTFTIGLGPVGRFLLTGSADPVRNAGVVPLFTGTPAARPESGRITLDTARVQALPLDTAKAQVRGQAIVGTAVISVLIASDVSTNPCEEGVAVGAFHLSIDGGGVTIAETGLDLPPAALDFVVSGAFTICLEAGATTDVEIIIEDFGCTFGPPAADDDDDDELPECFTDEDCAEGEVCVDFVCAPDDGDGTIEPQCLVDADCAAGETCQDSMCVPDGGDDEPPLAPGHSLAVILHRGSEQLVAVPNAAATQAAVFDAHFRINDIALSGDGTRVWFTLYDDFIVEGEVAHELWFVNTDGSAGMRSSPDFDDVKGPLTVATNEDGSIAIADSGFSSTSFLSAAPGGAASLVLDTAALGSGGCSRGYTALLDDGSRVFYRDYCTGRLHRVGLESGSGLPELIVERAVITNFNGFAARSFDEFDITSDGGQWILETEILDPSLMNTLFLNLVHSGGLTTPTAFQPLPSDTRNIRDVHITDDGGLIAYCQNSASISVPSSCYVQAPGSSERFEISDGRTLLGELALSDDGTTAYVRTNYISGPSTGYGFLQRVGSPDRLSSGSQRFSGTALPEFVNAELSENGAVLAAPTSLGVYVLHDGVNGLPGFPLIEQISYGYDETGRFLNVRVSLFPMTEGIERIFVLPLYKGLDATIEVPFEENPFYNDRGGGGVNWSTTFTPVENTSGVWERNIDMCDGGGNCKRSFITPDYRLRVVVVDGGGTQAVFQDFTPLP